MLVQVKEALRMRLFGVQVRNVDNKGPVTQQVEYPHNTRGWAGDSGLCGEKAVDLGASMLCDADSQSPCCSAEGKCGSSCDCTECVDMRKEAVQNRRQNHHWSEELRL